MVKNQHSLGIATQKTTLLTALDTLLKVMLRRMVGLLVHNITWCLSKADYDRLRNVRHQMLVGYLGCGNERAKTTSCPTPTRFSGQTPRALRRRYADEGYCSRAWWHALVRALAKEDVWGDARG